MIKNIIIFALFIAFTIAVNFPPAKDCPKPNQTADGCAAQKSCV